MDMLFKFIIMIFVSVAIMGSGMWLEQSFEYEEIGELIKIIGFFMIVAFVIISIITFLFT